MLKYSDLGGHKKLNQLVFAGSHDAAINEGGGSAKTQALNIAQQAWAGVRIFDIRIAARAGGALPSGQKATDMVSFHAPGVLKSILTPSNSHTRYVPELGQKTKVKETKLRAGTFGINLENILTQAKNFVSSGEGLDEFLILKFDKCSNWSLISEACVSILEDKIYKGGGNINLKTLNDVRGKVIVGFTMDGISEVDSLWRASPGYAHSRMTLAERGIVGIKNINKDKVPYQTSYDGLQYYGSGGTSVTGLSGFDENQKKQRKLMAQGAMSNPEAMGMMYWTITGLLGNIQKRNTKKLWSQPAQEKLKKLWYEGGMKTMVQNRIPQISLTSPSSANLVKQFIPNFVMMDFADTPKCQTIYDLNTTTAVAFSQL